MTLRAILVAAVACASLCAQPHVAIGEGRTWLIDTTADVQRVSISSPDIAEAVPVTPRTVMINAKKVGETSAVVWLADGSRSQYDIDVLTFAPALNAARLQIEREFDNHVQVSGDAAGVYLTGTVKDLFASARAESIAATAGKVVNLLNIDIPPQEQQILLKVRFADVDRAKATSLGANIIGVAAGYPVSVSPGVANPPSFTNITRSSATFTIANALNVLLFDPHADLGATIQALQSNNILQILAEPNLLAMNKHEASFVAGGEFPFPTLQGGGSGVGQVTIQFREFGIKLRFTPTLTPRGTIKLHVSPEVSSLDYANSLTVQGSVVPALSTRKVETDIELNDGQSFAIGGLLDQRTTQTLSRIPGLADIPILGKFFTSRTINKSNSELLVIVTPELVAPIPAEQPLPEIPRPVRFLEGAGILTLPPQTPGPSVTGPPPATLHRDQLPVQEMQKYEQDTKPQAPQADPAPVPQTTSMPAITQLPTATSDARRNNP